MSKFFDYLLLSLLPFWQQFFSLLATISWPLALILIVRSLKPFILNLFHDRGISFEGFGAQIRIDERKNAQIGDENRAAMPLNSTKFNLPRTPAIQEQEELLRNELDKLPQAERNEVTINALAIERLEKHFAFTYVDIFGSQLQLLQRINERGGSITLGNAQEYFTEVKSRFPDLSDWDLSRYCNYLVQRGLILLSDNVELTPVGKDFIHFVIKYGLRTDRFL